MFPPTWLLRPARDDPPEGTGKTLRPTGAHRLPARTLRGLPSRSPVPPRVYLTGFMASGKSTVGPLLADQLGYRFVDLDWLVEAQTGRSVTDLFAEGEAVFRAAETAALRETTGGDGLVVSTGGGTLVDPSNLILARGSGPVVWLRTSVPILTARVGDASGRPMLAGRDGRPLQGADLSERIADLLASREPYYAQADLVISADTTPDLVARDVAEALGRWRRGSVS